MGVWRGVCLWAYGAALLAVVGAVYRFPCWCFYLWLSLCRACVLEAAGRRGGGAVSVFGAVAVLILALPLEDPRLSPLDPHLPSPFTPPYPSPLTPPHPSPLAPHPSPLTPHPSRLRNLDPDPKPTNPRTQANGECDLFSLSLFLFAQANGWRTPTSCHRWQRSRSTRSYGPACMWARSCC